MFNSTTSRMKTLAIVLAAASSIAATSTGFAQTKPDFNKDILPILRDHCVKCHGAEKQKGKLRLDSKAEALKGGKSGKAVFVPGKPDESELIHRIILPKDSDDLMPPEGGPLPEATIKLLKEWVASGADWPADAVIKEAASPTAAAAPAAPARPRPPVPELPKDFKPGANEAAAIAAVAKANVDVRPLAQGVPWREANFRLQGTNITDKSIEALKDIPSLIELRLGTTKITDAGLAVVKSLPYLQVLSLELTGIGDAGLAHVKDAKNLTYLNLYGTQVTDAGLENLKGMTHLRNLYVWQSKVTEDGAKKLQEALPLLEINTGWKLPPSTNAPATNAPAADKK